MSNRSADRVTMLEAELRRRRWSREDAVAALVRTAHEMGLRGFALSVRQLDRWLSGEVQTPRGAACRVAEQLFGMPIEKLLAPPASAAHGPAGLDGSEPATVAEYVVAVAEESRDHAALLASGSIAPGTLEQLHAETHRLAHAYATTPPLPLLGALMRTRDLTYDCLARTRRPPQLAELSLIAGQVNGLAATTAFDLGQHEAAEDLARAARTYGEMIDHGPLKAWARGIQATIAFWSGRPREGLAHIASGLQDATGPAVVRLHAIAARAWALLGAEAEATAAARQALEARDRVGDGDELGEGIGGEFVFGPARFAMCLGAVRLALGDGHGAARYAAEALRQYAHAPDWQRRWAVEHGATMDLATARVLQGNPDGAIELLGPTLALDAERRTARLTRRLSVLRAAVNRPPYVGSPAARVVTAAVDEFATRSLTRSGQLALPAGRGDA